VLFLIAALAIPSMIRAQELRLVFRIVSRYL